MVIGEPEASRCVRALIAALALALSAFGAAPAAAQSYDEALAVELFHAGRELMEQRRWEEARAKFAESARLEATVGTLGSLAICERELGKLASARAHYQEALALARARADERLQTIEQQLAELEAIVPRIRIRVLQPVPGLLVLLDGVHIPHTSFGASLPLDPGRHTVSATAPERRSFSKTIDAVAGAPPATVDVPELVAIWRAAAKPAAPPPRLEAEPAIWPYQAVAGGVFASGLAVAGLGLFHAGLARERLDRSKQLGCVEELCPPAGAEARDQARASGDIATALLLAGGAAAAAGVIVWIVAPGRRRATAAPAPQVTSRLRASEGLRF